MDPLRGGQITALLGQGGENIYPKEIETVLHGHSAVLEAAVVGAPHPVYGEVPVALVAPYPDRIIEVDELLELCRTKLTKIKVPVAIHMVEAIPKNPVGKPDKPAIRKSHHH
ncbi:AMP-binding enzyme [Kribbella sp. NBC_00359]|uniref:AMP-binding enzyme n=1 Tax=Kribbella sp. NBC_00359 TaxID=2975966 RepID=UPI002E1DC5E9